MKTKHLRRAGALLLTLALLFTLLPLPASAADPGDLPDPPTIEVTALRIIGGDRTLKKGNALTLTAEVTPDGAQVEWSSSNPAVATVDPSTGEVTALETGTATITAKAGDKTATCTIKVPVPVSSVTVRPTSMELRIGGTTTGQLTAAVEPNNPEDRSVTWSSSNENIASVDSSSGFVTAEGVGTATITATANDGSGASGSCTVVVRGALSVPVTGVTVSPDKYELKVGEEKTLSAIFTPENASDTEKEVTWTISNERCVEKVKTTSSTIAIKGIKATTSPVTITATNKNGLKGACTVTVIQAIEKIELNKTELSLQAPGSETLIATITPANATDQTITWTSSNTKAATVDQTGKITAVGQGTTTITAKCGDKYATCAVTISLKPIGVTSIKITAQKPDGSAVSTQPNVSIATGGSLTLKAEVTPSNANDMDLEWTTTNNRIPVSPKKGDTVTVSVAAGVTAGTRTTIFVTDKKTNIQSAPIAIQVTAPAAPGVTGITITSPNTDAYRYVDPGKTFKLEAMFTPSNAPEKIAWTSSDTSIATVDQKGEVRGVAPGKCVITAEAGGFTATREIEVSGILLSYLKRPASGGKGEETPLRPTTVVDIFQYRDINVITQTFGNAKQKVINWESSNPSVAQAMGQGSTARVAGNYPGSNVTITANVAGTSYSASFKVNVAEDIADAITVSVGAEPSYSFSNLLSLLNSRSQSKAGAPLESVYNLKVPTKNGTLYYNYVSPSSPGHGIGGSERFYYQVSAQGQNALGKVTFVPVAGFTGTAIIEYNAAATNGTTFTGTIHIEGTATGDISFSTETDQPVALASKQFVDVCTNRTGRSIRYVNFDQPASSQGTLYQDYSTSGLYSPKVSNATRYYATGKPSIEQVTFVPAPGFQGDVNIPYRCIDSSGASFTGVVTIKVYSGPGSSAANGSVQYSTGVNRAVDLNAGDFNDASLQATNVNLNYITFNSLPSSSRGTLYLNYSNSSSTRVAAGTRYYRNTTPRISGITFVPASGYTGTVSIPYTGVNTSGSSFTASLLIHVGGSEGSVRYSVPRNQLVRFYSEDFNDASRRAISETLNYIRFGSLPSSSAGTLYVDYSNSSSVRVSTGTRYYRDSNPLISNITFVPASGYTGTVSIPYTGYGNSGDYYSDTITIVVGSGSSQVINYSAAANGSVRFNASDFNNVCRSATGDTLDYVRFDTTSTAYGSLYYQYNTASRTGTSVRSGDGYYYSGGRRLNDVTFAAGNSSGAAVIYYTGYSSRDRSFSGTVEVRVNTSGGMTPVNGGAYSGAHYTGSSAPIPIYASDFQNACQTALGTSLSSVQFSSLPAVGHMYQNYTGPGRTGGSVNTGVRYSVQDLNEMVYLPKAEYQGQLSLSYVGYDVQGRSFSDAVSIEISNAYCTTAFSDVVSGWEWAKPSIEFLRQSGITNGYSDNTFRPSREISRGEFTLMVCRAFQFSTGGNSGFPDVPANSVYAGAVATARDLGIVQGNNGRFRPDNPITRQSAMTMICRAMDAAGRTVPAASTGLLSDYRDGGQISSHARASVASLIQMGAVRGTQDMRLNPGAAISRAEMAVILHRVLAQ